MARTSGRFGFSRRAQLSLFFGYVLMIAGGVVGAFLLLLARFDPPAFAALRSAAGEVTAPVSSAASGATRWIGDVPGWIGGWFGVHSENTRLRERLAADERALIRAGVLAHENDRLRRLLQLRESGGGDIVTTGRLVSSSASSTRRFGLLNAGLWQGVREGQPVEAPDGLVGRVVEVGPDSARVLLLIDPESVIPVRRARDGLPAIAAGRGDALIDIRPVNTLAGDFRTGDLFVTSGAGGIFAPDVPVARLLRRASDGGVAAPLAPPETLDVAIVRRAYMPPPPPARPTAPR